MKAITKPLYYTAVSFAAAALCATFSIAHAADPGITDTSIKIGISAPLTGPAAAVGAVSEGLRLRVAAANNAGGVKMGDGKTRQIELVIQDDDFNPQRTLINVRRMVEQDKVFALVGVPGTPNNQAIGRYLEQRKIPNLFMYSGVQELEEGPNWMIGLIPSFSIEAVAFAHYLHSNKPNAKVAILYLNTETGQTFKSAFAQAIEGSAVQVVAEQPVTPVDPTIDTQMSNLKASGADTLIIVSPPRQGAQGIKYATESGWKPTTMVSYIASALPSIRPAGLENAKGIISSQFIKSISEAAASDDPHVRQYLDEHASVKPRFHYEDTMAQGGYVTGDALIKVLEAMPTPTRQAMMDAARQMKGVKLGLLSPGITLTTNGAEDPYPIESLQMIQFNGTEYEPLGELLSFEGRTPKHQ